MVTAITRVEATRFRPLYGARIIDAPPWHARSG